MSRLELRASAGLAGIYGLRMLGMFLILPVFAVYAEQLPGGENHMLIGLALGVYGLSQALLQLPFGMLSDHYGRKRIIYAGLLLFAAGSFIAGTADNLYLIIFGRAIQGAGAISAAVTALLADLTREEHRTKAMAMIGTTIGATFALSLVAGPALYHLIGVPGIFIMTGILAILAMLVVRSIVPDPKISVFHSDAEAAPGKLSATFKDKQLLRLNFGIFTLHAVQMAMFVIIPFALIKTSGISESQHWKIYLPVMIVSFLFMVPAIIYGESKAKLKPIFVACVVVLLAAEVLLAFMVDNFWGIVAGLVGFFIAFNVLEASLPSLVSKIAPSASKGTAIGVYNTAQSFGMFIGGAVGGYLSHQLGASAVFLFGAILIGIWLMFAVSMQTPPAVRSKMYHIDGQISAAQAQALSQRLRGLDGVAEAMILPEEQVAYLKLKLGYKDEQQILQILERGR